MNLMLNIQHMKILSVDDQPVNLHMIEAYAARLNLNVESFSNPLAALNRAKEHEFDLVITDYMMPEMDGLAFVKQLRAIHPLIPIIMLTALEDSFQLRLEALSAGSNDFLTKPVDSTMFRARVMNLLRLRKAQEIIENKAAQLESANLNLEQRIEERTNELIHTQELLSIQERMASIGQLASGISHEINNPLNFIRTNFAVLSDSFKDLNSALQKTRNGLREITTCPPQSIDEDILKIEHLLRIIDNSDIDFILTDTPNLFRETEIGFQRVSGIIRNMRDFSRVDDLSERSLANINEGILSSLLLAKNEYKYHAEVVTELGELPEIYCFPGQLNQVFLNLIINSSQAIAAQRRSDKGTIRIHSYLNAGKVVCEFADDGPGIPMKDRHRIFEPFFTTKSAGDGTGLGLSICYNIVTKQHQGNLTVSCPEGGGTLFTLQLPIDSREGASR